MSSSPHDTPDAGLQGRRILIVEDEFLLAMELQTLLEQQGCEVLGPINTVARALILLEKERTDAVLLDLDLNGERTTRVASFLSAKRVPFVIVSGYSRSTLSDPVLRGAPHIDKPIHHRVLLQVLSEACASAQQNRMVLR
jgi:DNA-binding NtrC family response regulator